MADGSNEHAEVVEDPLGPWEPMALADVIDLFANAPFRWWVAGGHALEAHLGRSWRPHDDIDLGISRPDVEALVRCLPGWDVHLAHDGVLTPWDSASLGDDLDRTGNLWCRREPDGAWVLDVLIGEGDEKQWIYKRDASVRREWSQVVLSTDQGVPYLAPEVQLLFKSETPRPKDHVDAEVVIPELDDDRQAWLVDHLPADHPWQALCAPTPTN